MWNVVKLGAELYCPKALTHTTVAPSVLLPTWHIKYPYVDLWPERGEFEDELSRLKDDTLREVSACEILAKNPHRNIAEYLGCLVEDGYIKGIVYKKYEETLEEKVNLYGLEKAHFQYGEYPLQHGRDVFIAEAKSAIEHLHSLGLVHNDLKPGNLMIDAIGSAILIDFDSCLPIGASCFGIGQTPGWFDLEMKVSDRSNDRFALMEIAEWLSDRKGRDKCYMFDE